MGVAQGIGTGVAGVASSIGQIAAQKEANKANLEIARQNNETSMKLAKDNNQLQVDMMRENNDFNRRMALDMFDLETAYNRPLEQVKRFREAGLNPALMMEGAGAVASGNGDASTPSASPSGISPVMPTLTTPHIEPVPSFATGFIGALNSLAQVTLANAEAKKKGVDTERLEKMLPYEIESLIANKENTEADTYYKEAQTSYQELITRLEQTYGSKKRGQEIANMIADYVLALSKGETEKAQQLYYAAEKELTTTRNENERIQAPIILENLKKTGRAIDASASASRAAANASNAHAVKTKEETRITRAEARIIEATEDDVIYARRLANAHDFQDLGEKAATWLYRFEELKNRKLITDEQLKEVKEAVEKAKKENSVYYWNFALSLVERINNGANKWAPWALSRTDGAPSPGEGMMLQSWQSTSTR